MPLDQVYIRLLTRAPEDREKRRRGDKDHKGLHLEQQTMGLEKALARHPFLVVVGDPGSGKTTFLRYLAGHLARGLRGDGRARRALELAVDAELPVPLLVPLRTLAAHLPPPPQPVDRGTLADALEAMGQRENLGLPPGFVRRSLGARRLALLLDGLDEIPDEAHRERICAAVAGAAACLERSEGPGLVVLTSRPRAYQGSSRLAPPFAHSRILGLGRRDIRRFAGGWVRAVYRVAPGAELCAHPEAASELEGLLAALEGNVAIREMARTPVLLTVLALVYNAHRRLPEQRARLYDEAVDVALRRFRDHPHWTRRAAREHLAAVAARIISASDPARLRDDEDRDLVLEVIARRVEAMPADAPAPKIPAAARKQAEAFVTHQELQAGLLCAPDGRTCRFAHRTFQEFLAAWWFADALADEQLFVLFAAHMDQAAWQETLRLLGGVMAMGGSARVGRLLAHLVGDAQDPLEPRAPGIAAAMGLLADVEKFDVDPAVLAPIRSETEGLMALLEDPTTPRDTRIGLANALGRVGDPRLGYKDDQHLILIPAGPFWRGSEHKHADNDEQPVRQIKLSEFRILRHPVTCACFAEFVCHEQYRQPELWPDGFQTREDPEADLARWMTTPNHPVTNVNWFEAAAFCRWLQRVRPRNDEWTWALPSEAQWEKAARGGVILADGEPNPLPRREYPWGDEWDASRANSYEGEDRVNGTTPVGAYPNGHGPYGIWDQAGNVYEWCLDWFDPGAYALDRDRDPVVDQKSPQVSGRVLRGGCWSDVNRGDFRVSYRFGFGPVARGGGIGFRVVAAPRSLALDA